MNNTRDPDEIHKILTQGYATELARIRNEANIASQRIKQFTDKKTEYEAMKRDLEQVAGIPCLDRMDHYYNHLVEAMQKRATEEEYKNFAKQLRLLEGYKDSAELADKCGKLADEYVMREKKARYDSMVQEKNNASSEYEYKRLANEFREMGSYEDSARLANECDKLADECGKREKKARYDALVQEKPNASSEDKYNYLAQEFRKMGAYENAVQLANECDQLAIKTRYKKLIQEKYETTTEEKYIELSKQFRKMGGYENSTQLADECDKQISILKERREEQEREEREQREKQEREKKRKERIGNFISDIFLFILEHWIAIGIGILIILSIILNL